MKGSKRHKQGGGRLSNGRENLKPFTVETARENGRKGGYASAKAKRKKANFKQAMQTLLAMDVSSEKSKEQLEALGVEATNEMLLAFATFQQAVKGNQRAVENVIKLSTTEKDKHDIAEQKERIKALKLKNKQIEELGGAEDEEIIIIADIPRE